MLNCVIVEKQLFFRSIVLSFISMDYLKVVYNARHRTTMTRLIILNIRLHVETGSWSNNVFVNVVSLIVLRMNIILF